MQALVVPEGVQTSDRRMMAPGSLTWRDPAPLMFLDRTTLGHDDAVFVGNLVNFRRQTVDGQTWVVADVEWDDDEQAREAERLAAEGKIPGVSADVAATGVEIEILEVDEFGEPTDWREVVTEGEIIGATQLPMPAFGDARLTTDALAASGRLVVEIALTAAANPKATADWFTDPNLPGPTPLRVNDEGRVYGHLATWGTCHIGFDGACVTPPTSEQSYALFHTGAVMVDGDEIPVGHITLGTGHANLRAGAKAAAEHYDNTGACAADVAVGEDEHGIWVAGAARPGADLDALRAASLSGDWRNVDGNLELVAALAVNVPGFPIPRVAARVASGEQTALVASGVVEHREVSDLELVAEALSALSTKLDRVLLTAGKAVDDSEFRLVEIDGDWFGAAPLHLTDMEMAKTVTVTESSVGDTPRQLSGLAAMLAHGPDPDVE